MLSRIKIRRECWLVVLGGVVLIEEAVGMGVASLKLSALPSSAKCYERLSNIISIHTAFHVHFDRGILYNSLKSHPIL